MYSTINEQKPEIHLNVVKDQEAENEKCCSCVKNIIAFFLFILSSINIYLFVYIRNFREISAVLIGFGSSCGFLYIVYLIIQLCYLHYSFRFLKVSPLNTKQFLSKCNEIFNAKPKVTLFGEITRHCSELELTKDEYGRTVYRNVSSLYVVNADYPFLSYRDISGSLSLTSEEISNKKILVLDLTSDVTLADDETKADVEERKKEVLQKMGNDAIEPPNIQENPELAQQIMLGNTNVKDCTLRTDIEGFKYKKKQLVLFIKNKSPCCYGIFWYLLFTFIPILPFGECYRKYINSMITFKKFTVTKTVSCKNDLQSQQKDIEYKDSKPRVILPNQEDCNLDYTPIEGICNNTVTNKDGLIIENDKNYYNSP